MPEMLLFVLPVFVAQPWQPLMLLATGVAVLMMQGVYKLAGYIAHAWHESRLHLPHHWQGRLGRWPLTSKIENGQCARIKRTARCIWHGLQARREPIGTGAAGDTIIGRQWWWP